MKVAPEALEKRMKKLKGSKRDPGDKLASPESQVPMKLNKQPPAPMKFKKPNPAAIQRRLTKNQRR